MKNRIKEVMDYKGMAQINFANFIGISPASLSSIFNGRTRPTLNIVEAIKAKIPEISTDWLLFGNGSMIQGDAAQPPLHPTGDEEAEHQEDTVTAHPAIKSNTKPTPQKEELMLDFGSNETENENLVVVKNIDKHSRKIAEIRVYFDDQTFETFRPVDN